jgi:hypothetical protein
LSANIATREYFYEEIEEISCGGGFARRRNLHLYRKGKFGTYNAVYE